MALSHKDAECEEEGSDSESDYSEADDTDDGKLNFIQLLLVYTSFIRNNFIIYLP